jgi:hypothetical protein
MSPVVLLMCGWFQDIPGPSAADVGVMTIV